MKNKKEAVHKRNKKKAKKEKARRLRQKQARQEREKTKLKTRNINIGSASDWHSFLHDEEVKKNPYHQLIVFPNEERVLGRQDKPGLLSLYFQQKMEMVLSLMNTGQVVPDHLGLAVLFSCEGSDVVTAKAGDVEIQSTSLMGFPIKEQFDNELFSFQSLESWGEVLEQSVREALAMHEEKSGKSLRSFGLWLVPIKGPFRESAIWREMGKDADLVRKPYAIRY